MKIRNPAIHRYVVKAEVCAEFRTTRSEHRGLVVVNEDGVQVLEWCSMLAGYHPSRGDFTAPTDVLIKAIKAYEEAAALEPVEA